MITQKDERIMVGILVGLAIWIVALIVSLFFWQWQPCVTLWIVITGLILVCTKGAYRRWYNRMFGTNY